MRCIFGSLLILILGTSLSQASAVLKHHYTFEQNVDDQVGTLHGTVSGAVSANYASTDPIAGNYAIDFNGPPYDFVDLGGPAHVGDQFSISGWFKAFTTNQSVTIVSARAGGNARANGFSLYYWPSSERLEFVSAISSRHSPARLPNFVVEVNRWYHVATTVDLNNATAVLYLDGVEVARNEDIVTTFNRDQHWTFSSMSANGANISNSAELDEIQIYDGLLSDAQVADLYANPGSTASTIPAPLGLIGALPLAWFVTRRRV